ncbi:KH domain-containing protein [Salibacterium qingdaonense]|uniref:RNA-binding protein KhpA n=1 Tax=Salibacterium qingdaonense TaxID=266892 RepID=A0A1I4PG90_9BACI|nr:KH domain-containing protein [Salibacterium qingdaonense]SFM26791.1 RNA-binding protein (KH domain) [Salibacterium qingdaonense]
MKQLVKTMARPLVDFPDEMEVTERREGEILVLTLTVHENDMGKVIGKQGGTANAMRSILQAGASYQQERVRLDIIK